MKVILTDALGTFNENDIERLAGTKEVEIEVDSRKGAAASIDAINIEFSLSLFELTSLVYAPLFQITFQRITDVFKKKEKQNEFKEDYQKNLMSQFSNGNTMFFLLFEGTMEVEKIKYLYEESYEIIKNWSEDFNGVVFINMFNGYKIEVLKSTDHVEKYPRVFP